MHPAPGTQGGGAALRGRDQVLRSRARLALPPPSGFIGGPPEFAVEVRSPSDRGIAAIERGGGWIGHYVRAVGVVDPARARLVEMRPGAEPREVGAGQRASARPVLDLDVAIAVLFEGLG